MHSYGISYNSVCHVLIFQQTIYSKQHLFDLIEGLRSL